MHRDFIFIQLDTPAPQGGLPITLTSSDTTRVTVPSTVVNVPAGSFSATFTVTGLATTHDSQGVDHPVTVSATAPQPWIGTSTAVSVTNPVLQINGLATSRTTQSSLNQINISIINPACNCGDLLNAGPVSIGLSIQSNTSGITTVSPTSVTVATNAQTSGLAGLSTPTTTGTYTLVVTASGFAQLVSSVVTVQ
jgi:hypothetical protein